MIDFSPFWKTLAESKESRYSLVTKYHVSSSTLYRLKHNKPISTKTLDCLCDILDCDIPDIMIRCPSEREY